MKDQAHRPAKMVVMAAVFMTLASTIGRGQTIGIPDSAIPTKPVAVREGDSSKTAAQKVCAGKLVLWCRIQAHQRKLEQRRHYNPAVCATLRVVGTATGATNMAAPAMLFSGLLILANAPAAIIDGLLIGAPIAGGVIGYKSQESEKECKHDPPAETPFHAPTNDEARSHEPLRPKPPAGSPEL